jgi:hypothetical protein
LPWATFYGAIFQVSKIQVSDKTPTIALKQFQPYMGDLIGAIEFFLLPTFLGRQSQLQVYNL